VNTWESGDAGSEATEELELIRVFSGADFSGLLATLPRVVAGLVTVGGVETAIVEAA
jgi:hypothetical protein